MIEAGIFADDAVDFHDGALQPSTGPGRYRFTLDQYHRMIEADVLTEDDPVEFLHGEVVPKMPHGDPHGLCIERLDRLFARLLPDEVSVRCQLPVVCGEDEPEPDFTLCVPSEERNNRHPRPEHVYLVVEVADSSVGIDRTEMAAIYARSGIPVYWIVNLEDGQVEVYTEPNTPTVGNSFYRNRIDVKPGQDLSVVIRGNDLGRLAVSNILPPASR
jgi:Uma2 family endonuclease